jgi:hypothetical protein
LAVYLLAQPEAAILLSWIVIAAVAGVALVVLVVVRYSKTSTKKLYAAVASLLVVGIIVFVLLNPFAQNSVTVSSGQISINAPFISSTVHSDQIVQAYVVNLNSWNLSLSSRNVGTSLGTYDEGTFTLSNGAAADVMTNSNMNLVVKTTSGLYLILAPDNFQAFLSDFSSNVVPADQLPTAS